MCRNILKMDQKLIWLIPILSIVAPSVGLPQGQVGSEHGSNSALQTHFAPFSPIAHRDKCRSGFSVRKAKRSTLKAKTRIEFEHVITNAGGWDSNEHVFEPKCAGTYFFTFHAVSDEKDDFTLALMKEGIYQVTAFGARNGYHSGSNSALLFLNPGDKVYLELQGGTLYEHPYDEAYTTFTGILASTF